MKKLFHMKWFTALLFVSLFVSPAFKSASAAAMLTPASDGNGYMSVLPVSATYGTTGNTFTFTFIAENDFVSGDAIILNIPNSGWSAPTTSAGAGNIAVTNINCVQAPAVGGISGMAINIDAVCNSGQSFTITYSNVTVSGVVSGSPYQFTTQTDISGGNGPTNLSHGSPTIAVNRKALTMSGVTTDTRVYDGTTTATLGFGSAQLNGIYGSDVVSLVTGGYSASFDTKNVGTGKAVNVSGLTINGIDSGNYTITQPTSSGSITQKSITVIAGTDTKTYDGTTSSGGVPTLSVSTPLALGDTEPVWTQIFDNRNAGTGKDLIPAGLVNDGNGGNNYSYTYQHDHTGAINKLPITVAATADTKTYDGTTSSSGIPTLSLSTPLASGDSQPVWTQTFDNKNAGTGKTLTPAGLVNDGNGGNNYSYKYTQVTTGTINSKAITVTPQTATKVYDGTTSSSASPSISPALVSGDTSAFIETFDTPTVGTNKTLTASGHANDGNNGSNYNVTFGMPSATSTITKANPVLSITNSPAAYTGSPIAVQISSSTPGTVFNVKYNGSTKIPMAGQTYKITASFTPSDSTDYNNLANVSSGNFVITQERTKNGGFNTYVKTSKIPQYWIAASYATNDGKDATIMEEGIASVKVTGATGITKTLTQTIALKGLTGSLFTFSFWTQGSAIPAGPGVCQAQILVYSGTSVKQTKTVNCSTGTYSFQQNTLTFNATTAFTKVVIKFIYSLNSGTVWFDNVSLVE